MTPRASSGRAAPSSEDAIAPFLPFLRKQPLLEERFRLILARPSLILHAAGMDRDPWQEGIIGCRERQILMSGARQGAGKSTTVAGRALALCMEGPRRKVYIGGPKEDQSKEVLEKVSDLVTRLGFDGPVVAPGDLQTLSVKLRNRSKIVALSGSPTGIRGKTAHEVIVTEAALASDKYIAAFSPSRGVTGGSIVLESTPFGRRGMFWRAFNGEAGEWKVFFRPASECKRLTPEFLAAERANNPLLYRQEFLLEFLEELGALFSAADIEAAFQTGTRPMVFKARAEAKTGDVPLVVPMPEDRSMFTDALS